MADSIAPPPLNSPLSANESARLAALYRYNILDTSTETAFDRITSLAARLFKVPTVLISLVDESRAWFKSSIGFDASEVPRDATIYSFAVLTDVPLIVPDTQLDDRFACNPLVQCEPGLRFYAGAPLLSHDGFNLGTLCLLDTEPHASLTAEQQATLVDLAAIVVDELELRLAARQIAKVDAALLEITQGVATVTGDAFTEALVLHFAKVLDANYVYIGLIEGDEPKRCEIVGEPVKSGCNHAESGGSCVAPSSATRQMMRTIATCDRGRIVDNLEYLLHDTPCWEAIVQRKICCHPRNVQAEFPNAPLLELLAVESYIATPFCNARGEVLGVLGVMDGKPLENEQLTQSLLTIFADRIATEIERQQVERDLLESQRLAQSQLIEIEAIYQTAPVGLAILDADLRFQRLNRGLAEINGIAIEDHIGRTVREIVPNLADEAEPLFRQVLETGEPILNLEISGETIAQPGVKRTWVENWYPLADETGRNVGINAVVQEITDRKRMELLLAEQTRLLEAIATGQSLDECLSQLCSAVAKLSPNTLACVLLADDLRQQFPRSIAPDFPPSFRVGLQNAPIYKLAIGASGIAVYGGEPVGADIAHDENWSNLCVAHGILACHATPIIGSDRSPWGSLMLCFNEARQPTEWEDRLSEFGAKIASITIDRKLAIEQLTESEERLSLAIVAADMATWDADLATGRSIWAAKHFQLLGYAPTADSTATMEMWQSRVHPDDLADLKAAREIARSGKSLYKVEYRAIRADNGHVVWLAATGRFSYDRSGVAVRFTGVIFDISDRKQVEADLQQSQALAHRQLLEIEAIYQTAPIGLTIFDTQLRYQRVNQRLAEINGISIDEHIGRTLREVVPTVSDENEPLLYQVLATGEPLLNLEISGETQAQPGVYRTWIENCYPLKDETGRIVGINVVVQEITDRKQLEVALTERNQELDSFVHIVSHDLKAPLRAISNLSVWIEEDLDGALPPANQEQFQLLRSRVKRMESTIDALLVYARAGRQEVVLETFNVAELLAEIIDSLSPPQSFTITIAPPLPTLTTNRLFLCQVLTNLISNAYKHHPSPDGHLDITAIERRDCCEFILKDNGAGIAPENQAKIFAIFQTLKSQDNVDSTGVGLAIVKKIVETEGGTIRLESELGQGTTFYVTWPKNHK